MKKEYVPLIVPILSLMVFGASCQQRVVNPSPFIPQVPISTTNEPVNTNRTYPTAFLTAHIVSLDQVKRISKFRSGSGHSFTDNTETCRSMKHYVELLTRKNLGPNELLSDAYPATVPVFSPVDGTVTQITAEQFPLGQHFRITPTINPDFLVQLFHLFPLPTIHQGSAIRAGDQIGTIKAVQQYDVAIEKMDPTGRGTGQYVSMFDVMDSSLLADYARLGVTKENAIVSKESRDAHPLTCTGEQFSHTFERPEDWVVLQHPAT